MTSFIPKKPIPFMPHSLYIEETGKGKRFKKYFQKFKDAKLIRILIEKNVEEEGVYFHMLDSFSIGLSESIKILVDCHLKSILTKIYYIVTSPSPFSGIGVVTRHSFLSILAF